MANIQVFDSRATNGNSTEVKVKDTFQGMVTLFGDGTWDSGVMKVQVNPEASGGTWLDADTQTLAAANGILYVLVAGAKRVRVNLASVAGGAADLDAFLSFPDEMLDITQTDN